MESFQSNDAKDLELVSAIHQSSIDTRTQINTTQRHAKAFLIYGYVSYELCAVNYNHNPQ